MVPNHQPDLGMTTEKSQVISGRAGWRLTEQQQQQPKKKYLVKLGMVHGLGFTMFCGWKVEALTKNWVKPALLDAWSKSVSPIANSSIWFFSA